jgi:hypothetical protein
MAQIPAYLRNPSVSIGAAESDANRPERASRLAPTTWVLSGEAHDATGAAVAHRLFW